MASSLKKRKAGDALEEEQPSSKRNKRDEPVQDDTCSVTSSSAAAAASSAASSSVSTLSAKSSTTTTKSPTVLELLNIHSRNSEDARDESQRKVSELIKIQKKLQNMFGIGLDSPDFGDKIVEELVNLETRCIKKGMFAAKQNNVLPLEPYVTLGIPGLFKYVKDSSAIGCPILGIAYDLKYFTKSHYDALLYESEPKWKLSPSTYNGPRLLVRTRFWITACNTIQKRLDNKTLEIKDDDWEKLRHILLIIWKKLHLLNPEEKVPDEIRREYEKSTHYWQTNWKTNRPEKKPAFETTDFEKEVWHTILVFFKNPTEAYMKGIPYTWGYNSTTNTKSVEIMIDDSDYFL